MESGSGSSSGGPVGGTTQVSTSTGVVSTLTSAAASTSGVTTDAGDGPGTTSTTESGSDASDSTGGDPLDSVCDPQPTEAAPLLLLDEAPLYETKHLEFEGACTVAGILDEEEVWSFDFECGADTFRVSVGYLYPSNLQVGDGVQLSIFIDSPWWGNGYVKVMREGMLEFAAMEGEGLPGGGPSLPPEDFFAPLSVELRADVCAVEPEWDGSFIGKPCTRDQRLGLSFTVDDATATVVDLNAGSFGPFDVSVGYTRNYVEVHCTDTPSGRRQFAVVRRPA